MDEWSTSKYCHANFPNGPMCSPKSKHGSSLGWSTRDLRFRSKRGVLGWGVQVEVAENRKKWHQMFACTIPGFYDWITCFWGTSWNIIISTVHRCCFLSQQLTTSSDQTWVHSLIWPCGAFKKWGIPKSPWVPIMNSSFMTCWLAWFGVELRTLKIFVAYLLDNYRTSMNFSHLNMEISVRPVISNWPWASPRRSRGTQGCGDSKMVSTTWGTIKWRFS